MGVLELDVMDADIPPSCRSRSRTSSGPAWAFLRAVSFFEKLWCSTDLTRLPSGHRYLYVNKMVPPDQFECPAELL
eukprot:7996192-Pyramimonas_sp.AAC.1